MLLKVKTAKMSPQSPKTAFGVQNQYGRVTYPSIGNVTYPSIGNVTWSKKKYTFGIEKAKISLQSPKTELAAKITMVV
jgi:hypothetical protein